MAKILIVDDMPLTHRLLRLMLSRDNHSAITAYNGAEALEKLREAPVDLMITDINMPDMDGWDLIEKIRGDDRWKQMPIIVMTASIQEHIRLLSESERDTKPILTQPITSRELNEAVSRCLQTAVVPTG